MNIRKVNTVIYLALILGAVVAVAGGLLWAASTVLGALAQAIMIGGLIVGGSGAFGMGVRLLFLRAFPSQERRARNQAREDLRAQLREIESADYAEELGVLVPSDEMLDRLEKTAVTLGASPKLAKQMREALLWTFPKVDIREQEQKEEPFIREQSSDAVG